MLKLIYSSGNNLRPKTCKATLLSFNTLRNLNSNNDISNDYLRMGLNCVTKHVWSRASHHVKRGTLCFQTTSVRRINPAIALVLRPLSKVFAIVVGRSIRKWWKSLPKDKKYIFIDHLFRNKWRYLGSLLMVGCSGVCLYDHFVSLTPYTDRKRLVIFDSSQVAKLSDFQFQEDFENLKDRLLASNHPSVLRTKQVCDRILRANGRMPQIYTKYWTVSVADIPEENCHVYPTGQIVMYKGMIDYVNNDDQLAIVLAHEISHAILEHTAELFTYATLLDLLVIIPLTLIWAILPNDGVAVVAHWFFKKVVDTMLQLPYNRKLEKEADALGLILAASACVDVREASAFWGRLDLMERYKQLRLKSGDDPPEVAFLSTHPSHSDRQSLIDESMAKALRTRDECKCPKLSKFDPRESVWALQEQFEAMEKAEKVKVVNGS